jgi:hypothetical protein
MKTPILMLVGTLLAASPAIASDVASVVDPYLRIQSALAQDSTDGVKESAQTIVAAAKKLGAPADSIGSSARELTAAADLKAARAAFWKLSEALLGYAEDTRSSLGNAKIAYCPMEKKYWVQKGGNVENPYGGKDNVRCGEFVTSRSKS